MGGGKKAPVAAPRMAVDADSTRWEGRGVRADAVAGQLLKLRKASFDEEGYPLTRASVMNLLVYVDRPGQVKAAMETVDRLAVRHPSRAIVVAPEPGEKFALDAEVVLHRHPLAAHSLAFERALLKPRGADPEALDTLVIPLLIPHLQSFLWWLGDPDPADPAMRSLGGICDRLVIDTSVAAPDRLEAVSNQLIGRAATRLVLGDLAWTRMEPAREVLARVFDEAGRVEFLEQVTSFEVVGDRPMRTAVTSAELLFAGWFASRLGYSHPMAATGGATLQTDATGNRTTFTFSGRRASSRPAAAPVTGGPGLQGFRVKASAGRRRLEVQLTLHRGEGHLVITQGGSSTSRTLAVAPLPEAEILSRELGRLGRDRVYEDALLSAARIRAVLPS
jgi:glucose-6-phosphate dehydrogenase assembly protein OpcA